MGTNYWWRRRRPTTAPKAPRTLDIDRFARNQCASLTSDQVASLGLGAFRTTSFDTGCRWSTDEKTTFDLRFVKVDTLGQVYRDANNGDWPVFEPFDVNGFPAVKRQQPNTDKDAVFNCNVTVGTAPSQGIEIIALNTGQRVDWCAKSVAAAQFVVHNLGG
ncbi:DUF3558 domain-containing protein [Kibdelosporangium lantanae]|uniref:DUF3558 domain-containing protein n=1 Tax=Kibdelosporangium lantanae TaxID=1497396 RepID=A0ABW3M861_9PSEU